MLNTHAYVSLGPYLCITIVVPANNDFRRKKLPEIVATMIHDLHYEDRSNPQHDTGATKQRQEKTGEDRKESTGWRGMASASGDRLGSYLQHIQVSLESMHKFWFYGPTTFTGSFSTSARRHIGSRLARLCIPKSSGSGG